MLFLQPAPRCEVAPAEAASFKVKFLEMKTKEEAIRSRWIKDEENWRKLPARAWPPTQPSEDDIESLKGKVASLCVTRDEACRDAGEDASVAVCACRCLGAFACQTRWSEPAARLPPQSLANLILLL